MIFAITQSCTLREEHLRSQLMQLGDFTAIPIPFFGGSYVHYLYVKQNKAKEGDEIDASKSLLATNLPLDFNEKDIAVIFEQAGAPNVFLNPMQTQDKVELSTEDMLNLDETNVKNASNPYSKYAVIVFENRKQAKAALNLSAIKAETMKKLDSILKEKQRGMKSY